MENGGIDPGMLALMNDDDKILKWLITLGFLGRRGGFLGGEEGVGAAAVLNNVTQSDVDAAKHAGATNAKLDCLTQGQSDAAVAAHNMQMINLFHSAEQARCAGNTALSAQITAVATQMAACCCDLKQGQAEIKCGQESIKNEMCKQTNILLEAGNRDTQRIIDVVNTHAKDELESKLVTCTSERDNARQTLQLTELGNMLANKVTEACNNNNGGHGRPD